MGVSREIRDSKSHIVILQYQKDIVKLVKFTTKCKFTTIALEKINCDKSQHRDSANRDKSRHHDSIVTICRDLSRFVAIHHDLSGFVENQGN